MPVAIQDRVYIGQRCRFVHASLGELHISEFIRDADRIAGNPVFQFKCVKATECASCPCNVRWGSLREASFIVDDDLATWVGEGPSVVFENNDTRFVFVEIVDLRGGESCATNRPRQL